MAPAAILARLLAAVLAWFIFSASPVANGGGTSQSRLPVDFSHHRGGAKGEQDQIARRQSQQPHRSRLCIVAPFAVQFELACEAAVSAKVTVVAFVTVAW